MNIHLTSLAGRTAAFMNPALFMNLHLTSFHEAKIGELHTLKVSTCSRAEPHNLGLG